MFGMHSRGAKVVEACEKKTRATYVVDGMRLEADVSPQGNPPYWGLQRLRTYFMSGSSMSFLGIFVTPEFDPNMPYSTSGIGITPLSMSPLLGKTPFARYFNASVELIQPNSIPEQFKRAFDKLTLEALRRELSGMDKSRGGETLRNTESILESMLNRLYPSLSANPSAGSGSIDRVAIFTMRVKPSGLPGVTIKATAPANDAALSHLAKAADICQASSIFEILSDRTGFSIVYNNGSWSIDDIFPLPNGLNLPHTLWVQPGKSGELNLDPNNGFGIACERVVKGQSQGTLMSMLGRHLSNSSWRTTTAAEVAPSVGGLIERFKKVEELIKPKDHPEVVTLRTTVSQIVRALERARATEDMILIRDKKPDP